MVFVVPYFVRVWKLFIESRDDSGHFPPLPAWSREVITKLFCPIYKSGPGTIECLHFVWYEYSKIWALWTVNSAAEGRESALCGNERVSQHKFNWNFFNLGWAAYILKCKHSMVPWATSHAYLGQGYKDYRLFAAPPCEPETIGSATQISLKNVYFYQKIFFFLRKSIWSSDFSKNC